MFIDTSIDIVNVIVIYIFFGLSIDVGIYIIIDIVTDIVINIVNVIVFLYFLWSQY
jgi:hypothetical protein